MIDINALLLSIFFVIPLSVLLFYGIKKNSSPWITHHLFSYYDTILVCLGMLLLMVNPLSFIVFVIYCLLLIPLLKNQNKISLQEGARRFFRLFLISIFMGITMILLKPTFVFLLWILISLGEFIYEIWLRSYYTLKNSNKEKFEIPSDLVQFIKNRFSNLNLSLIPIADEKINATAIPSGFKSANIIFSSLILKQWSLDNIKTLFIHEIAHIIQKHQLKLCVLKSISYGLMFIIIFFLIKHYQEHIPTAHFLGLVFFVVVLWYFLTQPIFNWIRRRFEYDADQFVLNNVDEKSFTELIQLLSELYPECIDFPWYFRVLFATHPSFKERLSVCSSQ